MAVSALVMGSMCFGKAKVGVRANANATSVASEPYSMLLRSQFFGTSISIQPITAPSMPAATTLKPILARRLCPFTGKKTNKANIVSFSNHKTRKLQFVNLQYKRIWWEGGKRWLKLRLSTKAIKTIEKNGLEAVAKKAGIELKKIR